MERIAGISSALTLFVTLLLCAAEHSLVPFWSVALTFGLGLIAVVKTDRKSAHLYVAIYCISAISTIALYLYYSKLYALPYYNGGSDDLSYEEDALSFARQFSLVQYTEIRNAIVADTYNSVGYVYLLAIVVKASALLGGFHTLMPRLLNASFLALLAVVVKNLGHTLGLRRESATAAGLLTGLLPVMLFAAAHSFRDVLVALLLTTVALLWTRALQARSSRAILTACMLSIPLLFGVAEMRLAQAFVATASILIGVASVDQSLNGSPRRNVARYIGVAAVGVILSMNPVVIEAGRKFVDGIEIYAQMRSENAATDGLSQIVFGSSLLPLGWILRVGYALSSPLPVVILPAYNAFLSIGTITHLLLLPFLGFGLLATAKRRLWWPIVAYLVMLFLGMALFTFTTRHIVQYLPFGVLIGALGYQEYSGDRWRPIRISAIGCLLLAVTYVLIKSRS